MIRVLIQTDRPDPERLRLFRSVFEPSTLDEVAEGVAVASETERRIYVERVGDRYRWSLTHPGGGYPLLRITARFLRVDYTKIMVPFRTVEEGVCVACRDPEDGTRADEWAVIEFEGLTASEVARVRIANLLGRPGWWHNAKRLTRRVARGARTEQSSRDENGASWVTD